MALCSFIAGGVGVSPTLDPQTNGFLLTTSLSDEAIAHTMEDVIGSYVPEWVAWQRRKLAEASAPS